MSDFSIQRLLSPQLGHKPAAVCFPPDGYLQGIPGGFSLDYRNVGPPVPVPVPVVPVPVPVPVCCADGFYGSYRSGFHHCDYSNFQNSGVYLMQLSQLDSADAQPLAGYHGYHQTESAQQQQQQQPRQKTRMRTVFTDTQTKQLEALFELTDYPAAEARAAVAGNIGLSEETVRVWFKNRRARRKRQRSDSNV